MRTPTRYQIVIRWTHRKWGPQSTKLKQEAHSIRKAVNQAMLAFFTAQHEAHAQSNKRPYLDAHKHVTVEAWRL